MLPFNIEPELTPLLPWPLAPPSYRGRGRSNSVRERSMSRSPSRSASGGSPTSPLTPRRPDTFVCDGCDVLRAVHRRDEYTGVCQYCMGAETNVKEHTRVCVNCRLEKQSVLFYENAAYLEGATLHTICLACRNLSPSTTASSFSLTPAATATATVRSDALSTPLPSTSLGGTSTASDFEPSPQDPIQSGQGPASLNMSSASLPRCSSPRQTPTGEPRPGQRRRDRDQAIADLSVPDPVITLDEFDLWEEDPALTERDYGLLQDFHRRLDRDVMETCSRCDERWFHMGMNNDDVCAACQKVDRDLDADEPFLFSDENDMNPGPLPKDLPPTHEGYRSPEDLPELSQVEEMLISRVHCFVEVRQVRGVQFKYRGHVVNFLCNTAKVYNKLPLLPGDLDIVIIRPSNYRDDPRLQRQFRRDYRVRRERVKKWLLFLRRFHPAYHPDVLDINDENLDTLPDDAYVDGELLVRELEADNNDNAEDEDLDEGEQTPEVGAVPDLHAQENELDEIQRQLSEAGLLTVGRQPRMHPSMSMATPQRTPISEFNKAHALLSWAFPTLFPFGKAEFVNPRVRDVEYPEYARHLLLYKDGRFARHPRYRYVVFNTMFRKQVNTRAGFFVRKLHPQMNDLTAEDLRHAFEDDSEQSEQLLNSISSYSGTLRGTRPYWGGKMKSLESIVRQLGCSHLFLTFSAADYHWESLMRHMPQHDGWLNATPEERVRIARDSVRDNPAIVAYHFYRRLKIFQEVVLKNKFNIVDSWHRFEWQARGSTHDHGLYWVDGAPDPEQLFTTEEREYFAKFWGIHVTGFNPEPNSGPRPHTERPTMSLRGGEIPNDASTLSSTVNRLQRHIHTDSYCLRKNKRTKEMECRFYLPEPLRAQAELLPHPERSWPQLYVARNDGMVNRYNRLTTMAWQANTDVSPCTSMQAVVEYIIKYAAKWEKQSQSFRELAATLLPFVNETRPIQSFVTKIMNKLIGDRDYSAQEVCHLLLDLPLCESSRTVVNVDMRPEVEHSHMYRIEGDEMRRGLSILEKYKQRPGDLENLTYIRFLKAHRHHHPYTERPFAKERVLNLWPRYPPDDVENYARAKLMLHHPFREVRDLLYISDIHDSSHASFTEAYLDCADICSHEHDGMETVLPDGEESAHEDDAATNVEEQERALNNMLPEFGQLAERLPDREGNNVNPEEVLGLRSFDLAAAWDDRIGNHDIPRDFWKQKKDESPVELRAQGAVEYNQLQAKQQVLYDEVIDHWTNYVSGFRPDQLLLHVDGAAGTGKTTVLMTICKKLEDSAEEFREVCPVIRSAPTGIAAHNILGRTIHSLLRLPVKKKNYEPLPRQLLTPLQQKLKGVRYLIIDEKSMVSLTQLSWIDRRSREIWPDRSDQDFAGLNVILVGDFCQLPPVAEKALFNTKHSVNSDHVSGQRLYKRFDRTVTLDVVMRQQGTDNEAVAFRQALEDLRNNKVTLQDWRLLSSRVRARLVGKEDLTLFDTALRIFPKKAEVHDFNRQRLIELNNPVINVYADHTGKGAEKTETEDAGNLSVELNLSIDSRIMLLENIWTEQGLFNGALGRIRDIVWEQAVTDPRKQAPFALLVDFDGYDGPEFVLDPQTSRKLVPIFRSTRDFQRGSQACTRTQFPITVAYAITIHKSQGIGVSKAVLNLKSKDFAPGLTYVAISRVRTLRGILFEEAFDLKRLRSKATETTVMRAADYARRSAQEVEPRVPDDLLDDDDGKSTQRGLSQSTNCMHRPPTSPALILCARSTSDAAHPPPRTSPL